MLDIQDLSVFVKKKKILQQVSLRVKSGEIHAVMGPNGSGKSTLALTIAGHPHYQVTKGSIHADKKDILSLSPDERARFGILLAFQNPVEIPGVSIQNFLKTAYEARFGKVKSVLQFRNMIKVLAKQIDVSETMLTRNVHEGFSGGEKKKIEILQLMVLKPRYVILDEPDSGLDVDAMKTIAKAIHALARKHNVGVVVITHYKRILTPIKPDFIHVFVHGSIVKTGKKSIANQLEKHGYAAFIS